MKRDLPLLDRLYQEPLLQEICRFVGYFGTTFRELQRKLELLGEAYGKRRAESASWHLCSFEGQNTVKPAPLAKVELRSDVRRYCFQLLGPPPEQWDQFYRNADGTPGSQHEAKMAELAERTGKPVQPGAKPKTPRAKKPAAPEPAAVRAEPKAKPKTRKKQKA